MTEIRLLDSIHDINARDWDKLWHTGYPFVQHAFLAALEDSGSTRTETGWRPRHLLLEDGEQLLAAMPLYEKHHSYGEYVFDWAWADAYHRHGVDYYPKLLSAIPFTPATGPRLAVATGFERGFAADTIRDFLREYCDQRGISSWHCLFLPPADRPLWQPSLLLRSGCQFHWHNRDYRDFADFLDNFNSRKRKAVRRERRQVEEAGVELKRLVGNEIGAQDWEQFYRFYHTTYLKRSGSAGYLTREFFHAIAQCMADRVLMVRASRAGRTIAAALCFFDEHSLYGRYWGCREEVPGLHFEACYYQGIEFAIERGLRLFDPGAQGEHKIQRGFEPTVTSSVHWVAEPGFRVAIGEFLQRERAAIEAYRLDCCAHLPFRQAE